MNRIELLSLQECRITHSDLAFLLSSPCGKSINHFDFTGSTITEGGFPYRAIPKQILHLSIPGQVVGDREVALLLEHPLLQFVLIGRVSNGALLSKTLDQMRNSTKPRFAFEIEE
jgi:hypothetical protein